MLPLIHSLPVRGTRLKPRAHEILIRRVSGAFANRNAEPRVCSAALHLFLFNSASLKFNPGDVKRIYFIELFVAPVFLHSLNILNICISPGYGWHQRNHHKPTVSTGNRRSFMGLYLSSLETVMWLFVMAIPRATKGMAPARVCFKFACRAHFLHGLCKKKSPQKYLMSK